MKNNDLSFWKLDPCNDQGKEYVLVTIINIIFIVIIVRSDLNDCTLVYNVYENLILIL